MKKHKSNILNLILFLTLNIHFHNLFGLESGTKVLTENGLVPVENLAVNQKVVGYNLKDSSYPRIPIADIIVFDQEDVVTITTQNGTVRASPDQLFYDNSLQKFVEAMDCNNQTTFLSYDGTACKCLSVERKAELTKFYSLSLQKPHLYFSSDACILTHNFAAGIPLTQWFLGTVIACVYFSQAPKVFTHLESAKKIMAQEQVNFAKKYNDFVSNGSNPTVCNKRAQTNRPAPEVVGIKTDVNIYNHFLRFPLLYGPMCCTAQMQSDGEVQTNLHIFRYDSESLNEERCVRICFFDWKNFGVSTLKRDNPLVQYFIQDEDNKQLKAMYDLIHKLPDYVRNSIFKLNMDVLDEANWLRKKYPGCGFEKVVYGTTFNIHAMCQMCNKKISPSTVKYVIKYGQCLPALNPDRFLYCHVGYNVAIVVEKCTGKVINVGFYNSDLWFLNAKAPAKTVDDILIGATPGDKTRGRSTIFEKPGSYEDAVKDFNSLGVSGIHDIPNGKAGLLPDGRDVNVRSQSSAEKPTIEIIDKKTNKRIKIRYGN